MIQYLPHLGALAAFLGSFGGLWRWVAKRFEQLELKLKACEHREDQGRDRRAKMWRVIDMLLDAIEDIEPQHRRLDRVRGLLAELRDDETKTALEPAE